MAVISLPQHTLRIYKYHMALVSPVKSSSFVIHMMKNMRPRYYIMRGVANTTMVDIQSVLIALYKPIKIR